MARNRIYVTKEDMERLRRLVDGGARYSADKNRSAAMLEEELDRAEVVDADRIPPDIVTMNSEVRLKDLDTGKILTYQIVYPGAKASGNAEPLSILAPLGTALLGYGSGDIIEWPVPRGVRRVEVLEVLYQPEAATARLDSTGERPS
jgi:regulator of nucleoside diphosphate kinase